MMIAGEIVLFQTAAGHFPWVVALLPLAVGPAFMLG